MVAFSPLSSLLQHFRPCTNSKKSSQTPFKGFGSVQNPTGPVSSRRITSTAHPQHRSTKMPSFSAFGAQMQPRLPPTPPDFHPGYSNVVSDQSCFYSNPASYSNTYRRPGRDFPDQYPQNSAYGAQQAMTAHAQPHISIHSGRDLSQITPYVPQIPSQQTYGSLTAAPILPPIRHHDDVADPLPPQFRAHNVQSQVDTKKKEEKATGGVALHLDYAMDMMANFVSEMSQGMYDLYTSGLRVADIDLMRSVSPGVFVSAQYRKYVLQILSSTRLPSSTIMLGLFYMAEHMKILSKSGMENRSTSTVYRMLTTGLLLGSKFLDDNTFQNRSWAEVSSIPVADLNRMELEWLFDFEWTIHGPMYHEDEGFFMWREHWLAYETNSKRAKAKASQKLTPINTNIARSRSIKQPLLSPEGPIPPQYQPTAHYDSHWRRNPFADYSPPSAPHSGPTTPEYYSNASGYYTQPPPPYSHSTWASVAASAMSAPRSQPPSYHQTPAYLSSYNSWTSHGLGCGCSSCTGSKFNDNIFHPTGHFGLQSVVG